jgi:hypothetical protein
MTMPPVIDKNWFSMSDIRRRTLGKSVWVPLAAAKKITEGTYGYVGWVEEYFGGGSVAVPLGLRSRGDQFDWSSLSNPQGVWASEKLYKPAEVIQLIEDENLGVALALIQRFETADIDEWHLNQDLVLAFGLKRENDTWVLPSENYQVVAKLSRDLDGRPTLLEIKNEFLKDYLCARGMYLRTAVFRSREVIVMALDDVGSPAIVQESSATETFEIRSNPILEGGHSPGSFGVFHISRNDVDINEDVPEPGPETDTNTDSKQWSGERQGKPLIRVIAELWRNEDIEPAEHSARIRGEAGPTGLRYIVDASADTKSSEELAANETLRWLWFKPEVVLDIAKRRGGYFAWYTQYTGGVGFNSGSIVHFGINKLGLVNVLAYDVANLPSWQQRVWAGHNVTPDGGVSEELLASQAKAAPADTTAPEVIFDDLVSRLNALVVQTIGSPLFRQHITDDRLELQVNRFRAIDKNGVLAMAKDIIRHTGERIDVGPLQAIAPPPSGEKWGSLKSLEKYLASLRTPEEARNVMGPLFGAYELRCADAHIAGHDLDQSFKLAGVDVSANPLQQGTQLIDSVVTALRGIYDVIDGQSSTPGPTQS